jgi:tetratricopeptide (TPR) repeat protein
MSEVLGVNKRSDISTFGRSAALKALELDSSLSEAHLGIAGIRWFEDWDWVGADQAFKRAFELNPASTDTCACYIAFLTSTGRTAEAIELAQKAIDRDPLSDILEGTYSFALYLARQYPEAVTHYQRAVQLNPGGLIGSTDIPLAYQHLGRLEEAKSVLDRPEFRTSPQMARVYALMGRKEEAQKLLAGMPAEAADSFGVSLAYFALGDKDRGFQWLTRAVDQKQLFASRITVEPALDDVRSDPRLKKLVQQVNIPW